MATVETGFNEMVTDFLKRQELSSLALTRQMKFAIKDSTMRMWTYGQPASVRLARVFANWVIENYPNEDKEKWLSFFDDDKKAA